MPEILSHTEEIFQLVKAEKEEVYKKLYNKMIEKEYMKVPVVNNKKKGIAFHIL